MKYLAHSARPKKAVPTQDYAKHVAAVVKGAASNAEAASEYSSTFGTLLQAATRIAAEFHDLGKLDDENQRVLRSDHGRLPINHVDAGVAHIFCERIDQVRQAAALLVYAHHVGLPALQEESVRGAGCVFRDETSLMSGISLREHTDQMLVEYLCRHESEVSSLPPIAEPTRSQAPSPLFLRIALSCLADADHSDTAIHYGDSIPVHPPSLEPAARLALLNEYVNGLSRGKHDERTVLRSTLYERCRDADVSAAMVACDSSVGSGKTTAVMAHLLTAANHKRLRRVIVVLPFTNIIDQSVDVYRQAIVRNDESPVDVVAAHHHRAEFDDLASRQLAYLWQAPVLVTTAVQFFETLAARGPAGLRKLHQIPGSAIFLDESHSALPAQLWPQAWRWLNDLVQNWGCHVIFGSGSLNRFWELSDFVDPPVRLPELVPSDARTASASGEKRRIRYRSHNTLLDLDGVTEFLERLPGPRLLIVNTVQSAGAIARHLAERLGGEHVEHLSTALTPRDRTATLDLVRLRLQRPNHSDWTLVATSCVEAGVDISFRVGVRERCSLTSLLQTSGRVNRSGEHGNAVVWDVRLSHDHLLRAHPAFDASSRVLGELFVEKKVCPESCTEALRREIRQEGMSQRNEAILKAERNGDFPTVEDLFRVIASDTVTAVVDVNLIEKLERGEEVTRDELQAGSIQVWQNRACDWALEELACIPGLMKWSLDYNGFLGCMAGVLPLVDMQESGLALV